MGSAVPTTTRTPWRPCRSRCTNVRCDAGSTVHARSSWHRCSTTSSSARRDWCADRAPRRPPRVRSVLEPRGRGVRRSGARARPGPGRDRGRGDRLRRHALRPRHVPGAARAAMGARLRAGRHRRRRRRRREPVRGRRPRARHVVRRELPDPRGPARRRARTRTRAALVGTGSGTRRVVRHHAVRVHASHDPGARRVGRRPGCRWWGRARRHRPGDVDGRAGARVRVDAGEARARGARRGRGHRRLLGSRARPEGCHPRAHGRRCRRRRRPGRRPPLRAGAPRPAVRGPLRGRRLRQRRAPGRAAQPGAAERPHR